MLRPKISFIIVTYNSAVFIRNCLLSIKKHVTVPYEIIIIDNYSEDKTCQEIERVLNKDDLIINMNSYDNTGNSFKRSSHIFIKSSRNLGFAKANNIGVRYSSGEVLFFLNPDTLLTENGIIKLYEFLVKNSNLGAVAPRLEFFNGEFQPSCRAFFHPRMIFYEILKTLKIKIDHIEKKQWNSYDTILKQASSPIKVEQPMAAALMIKKAVLDEIGLFDEQFDLFFNDVDLCYRISKYYEIWFFPEVVIKHYKGHSIYSNRVYSLKKSCNNMILYVKKHYYAKNTFFIWVIIIKLLFQMRILSVKMCCK